MGEEESMREESARDPGHVRLGCGIRGKVESSELRVYGLDMVDVDGILISR